MTEKPPADARDEDQEVARIDADDKPAGDESSPDANFGEPEFAVEEAPKKPSRLAGMTAFLALIVALASLAGFAYLFVAPPSEDTSTQEALAEVRASLRAAENSIADLESELAALERSASTDNVDIDGIERRLQTRLQDRFDSIESVPARVASIEQSLSALRGISTGARDAWLLAEAEYYMQIANAQAQLAANPVLAALALELADERLLELGDPGLTDIRRALAEEMRALEVLEAPDTAGAALTLASLAQVVDALPISEAIVPEAESDAPNAETASGTERALASLRRAMSGVVRVRRTDEAARPLLAPEAEYFLRANLSLQLQAARLALLRGEQVLFKQSLDDAVAWLREYYAVESTAVQSALQTIGEVRDSSFTRAVPDVSQSLRLLKSYIAFVDAEPDDAAAAGAEPELQP